MKILVDIIRFTDYCDSFYNVNHGLYKIATLKEIEQAVFIYMTEPRKVRIDFDSIDRENVRTILENQILNK
jgi:hypothetical protein